MADSDNRANVTCDHTQDTIENAENAALPAVPTVSARPRLGDGNDPWSTVLKDMLREAPKTGLTILAALVMSFLFVFIEIFNYASGGSVGMGPAAQPSGVPIRWIICELLGLIVR